MPAYGASDGRFEVLMLGAITMLNYLQPNIQCEQKKRALRAVFPYLSEEDASYWISFYDKLHNI